MRRLACLLALVSLAACGQTAQLVSACDTPYCEDEDLDNAPTPPPGMRYVPVSIGHDTNIESIRVRGDTVYIRATYRAYCGGTPPPGPMPFLLEVPSNVENVKWNSRRRGGRCKGPPRP